MRRTLWCTPSSVTATCPGYEQLRVLKESLECLPGVSKVMMRSDSAGYQKELLTLRRGKG